MWGFLFVFFKALSVFSIFLWQQLTKVSASVTGEWNFVRGCVHMWVMSHLEVKIKTVYPRGQQTMGCVPNLLSLVILDLMI